MTVRGTERDGHEQGQRDRARWTGTDGKQGIWTRKREIETRTGTETRRQVQGQRDMERNTNKDRDRGTG